MKVDYCILGVINACALRSMVDDIDEVGIIGLFDGGRNGEATHAKEAKVCCNYSRTDCAVGGFGEGFDVDYGFHDDRSYRTDMTDVDAQGLKPQVNVVEPLRG